MIWAWGIVGGVRGQVDRNAGVNVICPPIHVIAPTTSLSLYFDTIGYFHNSLCTGFTTGGEHIFRFNADCTTSYKFEMLTIHGGPFAYSVSYKISTLTNCDSIGYNCIWQDSSIWSQWTSSYKDYYTIPVIAGNTYDILIATSGNSLVPETIDMTLSKPDISNIHFFNINPTSISVSWTGTFEDVVIEYGPYGGFSPGHDTVPGVGGTIVHNLTSPYTFTGLSPDSTYSFYFRDKCGTYSNSSSFAKRLPKDCNSYPYLNCNTYFGVTIDANFYGAWYMGQCSGSNPYNTPEVIYRFTPDTSGYYTLQHPFGGTSTCMIGVFYKADSLACDENNWNCIAAGTNNSWSGNFYLDSGITYLILFKASRWSQCAWLLTSYFHFYCPSPLCSTAPTSITTTNNTICSNQSVTLTQVGGVLSTNGTFQWYADSCGGISLGTGYSKTFSPLDTTTYYVRAEDSCGVTTCASITINVNPSPTTPTITGVTAFCQGSSSVLNAGSGYTGYLWSNATTTQTILVSTPGTYTVTVTNGYSCTASASVIVTVSPLPVPVITGQLSFCFGGNTVLDAGMGYSSYLWSTSSTSQTLSVSTGNIYTVTVTNVNGCTGTASATPTVFPLPSAMIAGNASICNGVCTNLTIFFTGSPPFAYSYTDGVQTFGPFVTVVSPVSINVCPTVTTVYTLISVNDVNCSGTVSGVATVTVNSIPVPVITGLTNLCQGSTTTLNAGPGYPFYLWSTGANTQTINTGTTGIYTVTVTDMNGCTGSASATVTVHPSPVAVINPSVTTYICVGDTVHFTANTGTGYVYQWYKKSLPIAGATNAYYDATSNGRYSFLLTDSNSCDSVSASVIVTIVCVLPLDPPNDRMAAVTANEIIIVPNPAREEIQVLNLSEKTTNTIKIYSVLGIEVYMHQTTAEGQSTIDIRKFSNGVYFVIIDNGKEKAIKKFIKN